MKRTIILALGCLIMLEASAQVEPTLLAPLTNNESIRARKSISLTVEPIGFAPLPGSGAAVGYQWLPSTLIESSAHSGKVEVEEKVDSLTSYRMDIRSQFYELKLKQWVTDTFYLSGGLAQRVVEADADIRAFLALDTVDAKFQATSTGITLAIGNRWHWEYFTLGCDWIGAFIPLQKGKVEVTTRGEVDEDSRDDAKRDMERLALAGNIQLLRLSLGVAF